MALHNVSNNKSYGGWHKQYYHYSHALNCDMRFAIYLPPQSEQGEEVPVMYWLSGLTCNDENFMQKAGAMRIASELGIAIVATDTSPRGIGIADDDANDLGMGASFYINATEAPWRKNYQMYDYVVYELPDLIESFFNVSKKRAISGHSMGGHGALMIGIRNASLYSSISAFSPICNPVNCPWGIKAFTAYLGKSRKHWNDYDASLLMQQASTFIPTLIDQGKADPFLEEQLLTDSLLAEKNNFYPLKIRQHEGYDHSYYFVASFIEEHLRFHHKHFNESNGR